MHALSVLIVDNNPDVVKQLESALSEHDPLHQLELATTPEQALGFVRTLRPDLIIYDMPLTGSDDAQVIGEMKASLGGVRIIAISLYEHYGVAALNAGADEFISKTAPRSSLVAALRRQSAGIHASETR